MQYNHTVRGKFISRPNRFIAKVELDGKEETVHVKNTGRLGELLLPGADVVLQKADNPGRKTRYDLISVYKPYLGWVNIDSQVTNKIIFEWLEKQDFTYIKPEYTYGKSRIDFYMEKDGEKYLMEVKGCTLEREGKGWFPDAVSDRARKHNIELAEAAKQGFKCIIAFVIAMEGITEVYPNIAKDPKYAESFDYARECGVEVWHFACSVEPADIDICSVRKD